MKRDMAIANGRRTRKATIQDLYNIEGRAELVNGRIVKMSPTGYQHGRIATRILLSLHSYALAVRKGEVFADPVAFSVRLPHRGSFSPDVAYYTGRPPDDPMDFLPGPPEFAVAIRSKRDYGSGPEKRIRAKRADYFAAGTKVVWDVDPRKKTVAVYRVEAPDKPTVYTRGEDAEAEPAVPGWRLQLKEIFE